MRPMDFAKRTAANKLVDYLCADPENNMSKVMDKINAICPDALFPAQREAFTKVMSDPDNNMYQLMMRIMDLNPEVRNDMIKTVLVESNLIAWGIQEKMREKYRCNIPWAILLDPTSACNLHCTGCWAAEYGHKLNLSYDEIDSIIRQGKELGVHIYIYTGGEPLVRKHDLMRLCEAHSDCAFLCFTNATLIDEEFCQEMIRVKNFIPAISAEGDEAATDGRRGEGTYAKVETAMDLLNSHGLPFGVSICYTHDNAPSVASDEYFDWLIEKGALFAWIFTYMPVGVDTPTSLMPTPEDRERLYRFNRRIRVHPLFECQRPRDVATRLPALAHLHGLLRRAALQRQSPAAVSDARESRVHRAHGRGDGSPLHRFAGDRKRSRPCGEVSPCGTRVGPGGRKALDRSGGSACRTAQPHLQRSGRQRSGSPEAPGSHDACRLRSRP